MPSRLTRPAASLRLAVVVALSCLTTGARPAVPGADAPTVAPPGSRRAMPVVEPNDNRRAAGVARGGVTEIRLVAQLARWYPAGPSDSFVVVPALGEEGRAPLIPAPLVRVARGTSVQLTVRNALDDSLLLCLRASDGCRSADSLWLLPGESGTLRVPAADTGTFSYYAGLRRMTPAGRQIQRTQMTGAWVVDGPNPRPDRIFVLNGWGRPRPGPDGALNERFFIAINGMLWPGTERLSYETGDTVRWRLVNGTRDFHPMHLHGFYFTVLAQGDGHAEHAYAPEERRLAVTENMPVLGTALVEWVPTRAGNWLFHCHKALHVSMHRLADLRGGPARNFVDPPPSMIMPVVAGRDAAVNPNVMHALHEMSGMIIGIEVRPRRGTIAGDPFAEARAKARQVRVLMQERPRWFGSAAAFGFAVQQGDHEPRADSLVLPSMPIVLTKGEPVSITVVNRLRETSVVHWHGIELQSYFDGVGGWSGAGQRVAPMVAPGDSFVAHFTPPRAGTFMYHAHADEMRQLSSGLVAPLIVLEPGQKWDPARDHILMITQGGPSDTSSIVVNGRASGLPLELAAGVPHRFRVISMASQDEAVVTLLDQGAIGRWRALAKDGADLPPSQAIVERAQRRFGPGETFDFEITAPPGDLQLAVVSFTNVLLTLSFK